MPDPGPSALEISLAPIAEQYVKLVLAIGEHDAAYVDAYFGPSEWQEEAAAEAASIDTLHARALDLLEAVPASDPSTEPLLALRRDYLEKQLGAAEAYLRILGGERMPFDAEAKALYDVIPPTHDEAHFDSLISRLDAVLPGDGSIQERYIRFRRAYDIPPERLDTVFTTAIAESRRRTLEHLTLPEGESFSLEYVTDKPWGGYNWYQGNAQSLIQLNVELPIRIDRALDLAAHEGYPGHHVYNMLLEQHLARERDWPEFSIYVLFSPQSLIAEGTANYGIEVAFPGDERMTFERDVLFPLAGLDPATADDYYAVQALADQLSYAGNEAARAYLDGIIDADSASAYLQRYALRDAERARQSLRFIDTYRSYVINYNYGKDLVADYVRRSGGTDDRPERRWEIFGKMMSSPILPSGIAAK